MTEERKIVWHDGKVTKVDRERRQGHRGCVVWFTGLSGSGKSTLAHEVESRLFEMGVKSYVLDGDNVRHGLNSDLGFSPEDRKENIRRIGEVARLFADAGIIALTAFISPYRADRERARKIMNDDEFVEVYVRCSLEECERRDPKGMYKKARKGEIKEFTGISAPYEPPEGCELTIDTEKHTIDKCVNSILNYLREKNILKSN